MPGQTLGRDVKITVNENVLVLEIHLWNENSPTFQTEKTDPTALALSHFGPLFFSSSVSDHLDEQQFLRELVLILCREHMQLIWTEYYTN